MKPTGQFAADVENPDTMMALAQRALAHYQNKTTDQAPSVMQMPVDAYTNTERYRAERRRIFQCLPQAAALSLELPSPGDYKAFTIMETPVLLVRAEDGIVRAFLNVCRHRGARVCAAGSGRARVFTCPYHAWAYDRKGALVGRYGAETFGEVETSALGLKPLACEERCGLIWVLLTPDQTFDIDAWLGDFAGELATLELDRWHLYEQRTIDGPGWKVTMDGYLEAYHHNLVHQETVGRYTVGNLLVLDTFGPHQRLTFGRRSLEALQQQPQAEWQPGEHIRLIHSCFPNLSISGILGDHCLVSQIFPGSSPDRTTTVQTVLAAQAPVNDTARQATESFSSLVRKAVEEEDYGIGFGIQEAIDSGANAAFVFGRNEPAVQNYHRWIEKFMTQATGSAY